MPPLVLPSLVNGDSGDPALFLPFSCQREAYLFDIGDTTPLSSRNLLKISHVFVSHTHMDHFIGFDRLLRLVLGRDKTLHFFGPEGFLANVEGKLAGYCWNLVNNYSNSLVIKAAEIDGSQIKQRSYSCRHQFRQLEETRCNISTWPVTIREDAVHKVRAVILDHGLSCLGFSLEENFRINIRKDGLSRLGLCAGEWLHHFKQAIYERQNPDMIIAAPASEAAAGKKRFRFADLQQELAVISKGQKISYIADAAYTEENMEKIRTLAADSDHLFIEAAFLDADRDHALEKKHLTARQAGHIAAMANAGRYTLFHFSPRYDGTGPQAFYREADAAYRAAREKPRDP
ncbi:MAG TPA: ribonuclease Z [Desulfosalsimonadaceae bacterium]|nr:ribonuclease Z [Desulfosalsimonadaceae bacterium]